MKEMLEHDTEARSKVSWGEKRKIQLCCECSLPELSGAVFIMQYVFKNGNSQPSIHLLPFIRDQKMMCFVSISGAARRERSGNGFIFTKLPAYDSMAYPVQQGEEGRRQLMGRFRRQGSVAKGEALTVSPGETPWSICINIPVVGREGSPSD